MPAPSDDGGADAGQTSADAGPPTARPVYADEVIDAIGMEGGSFSDSSLATNGVRGAGLGAGSFDVYSLTYREGSSLTLRWSGSRVLDGPGDDFVVFENAFNYSETRSFMDPVVVELSRDGQTWVMFPHDYLALDEEVYDPSPLSWQGFAGLTPVLFHEEDNAVDPFDPALSGGDAFDLADLPDETEATRIVEEGFVFLRLSSAALHTNPDTAEPFVRDRASDGPDIDGVYARYLGFDPITQ